MPFRKNGTTRDPERATSNQPFSPNSVEKMSRLRGATQVDSVCPYCAVGCSQLVYVKGGKIIDIEGNPESPINAGTLCPKGSNAFQLTVNPHRINHVMYRAPFSAKWERKPLDWAMERIATLTRDAREQGFVESRDDTKLNHVTNMFSLGGATMDNEENYLIKKLLGAGLGVVPIENQARI
jgi:formate dehydrogenase major subunit